MERLRTQPCVQNALTVAAHSSQWGAGALSAGKAQEVYKQHTMLRVCLQSCPTDILHASTEDGMRRLRGERRLEYQLRGSGLFVTPFLLVRVKHMHCYSKWHLLSGMLAEVYAHAYAANLVCIM